MTDTKNWWQSRIIWVQIVATLFALGGAFKLLPEGLDQETIVSAIMAVVGVVTILLRLFAKHAIAPTPPAA